MLMGESLQLNVLMEMEKSCYVFYLTGSKAFTPGLSNDYDFFTDKEAIPFLQNHCFIKQPISIYLTDPSVEEVYRKAGIDVQIVKDVNKKLRVQEALKNWGKLYMYDKKTRAAIWQAMMEID